MNTLINLLKDRQVGKWCKLAAWVVVAIGLINVVLGVYTSVQQYNIVGQIGQNVLVSILLQNLRLVISLIPAYVFYFFVLYAIGVALDHFVGSTDEGAIDEDELDEDEESDLALDEEDGEDVEPVIVPGQME